MEFEQGNPCSLHQLILSVFDNPSSDPRELEKLENLTCPNKSSGLLATTSNTSSSLNLLSHHAPNILDQGQDLYAYVTPFIIVVGVIGNLISLRVFLSKRMINMSASAYLACLAISDTCVLLTHVLLDWLWRGLPRWPGGRSYNVIGISGMCQAYTYSSYVFRFTSAWYIVAFTIERFIGIYFPQSRKTLSRRTFAKRSLFVVSLLALLVSLYKPFLVSVRPARNAGNVCTWKPNHVMYSFALDSIYGCLITVIPFIVMLCLNVMMCCRLRRHKQRTLHQGILTTESSIKLEFSAILLVVSSAFIALNVPYFVTWCYNFVSQLQQPISPLKAATDMEELYASRGWKHIAKTIFFSKYCVNFFIYCLSGAYFRFQLTRHMPGCCYRICKNSSCCRRRNIEPRQTVQFLPRFLARLNSIDTTTSRHLSLVKLQNDDIVVIQHELLHRPLSCPARQN